MKKVLMIVGTVLVLGLVAGGSFWGGMTYQTNQANQARANFMNSRGGNGEQFPNGEQPADGQFPGGGQRMLGGGGTAGQVKSIDGDVMTISTAQDVTTVKLSESTQIQNTVTGTIGDLQPGMRVVVAGQRDSNGNITASQVTILNTNPPAAGTEP